ncbi:MAG TPA: ATP-binding protein [Sporolactobacillaceae bacterium]|nr:ATP-binding protein [Sporolactobacillaceae bacterium]
MKLLRACGCGKPSKAKRHHEPTDAPIEATFEEIEAIRLQLAGTEEALSRLWGEAVWSRNAECVKARAEAADLINLHFDGIIDQWTEATKMIFPAWYPDEAHQVHLKENLRNSLLRAVDHIRDPDNLCTYVYLRRHCQEGMISRAKPSEFNIIHISLKQVILNHVRANMTGPRMELIRDVVVAAIDERRLMVSQFYIEWRERLLRESEEKYRNTIDHAPDPMYEIEPHTWIVTGLNAAAKRLHEMEWEKGEPKHQIIGNRLTDLVPEEQRESVVESLETVLRQGSAQTSEFPVGPLFFDVNSALITFGKKQFIQMILRDVTQRREMLDSLLKAERLAAAGTFAAGVAHEVNNPLASISSLVQSILSGETDGQRRTTLHTILSQITRISSTLKDLVNFARPTTAQRRQVDVNGLIAETLRLITYNKRFSGIRVEPILAPDLRRAFADDNEIQQVLLNLLFNAADASPAEGSVIKVITENQRAGQGSDQSRRITIKVVDNGIGIPREHLERVFDPFFTTKPAGAGVGLGLSLCQRMILSNHGTIRVDSEVGRGTAVTITLQAPEEATRAQSAQSAA